jgi:polyferredoxin
MKKCPYCAEEIQDEAVKCKHCGEFIIDAELKRLKKEEKPEWFHRTPMVILWILLLGPFALPFIWKNPQYNTTNKTIWTIVMIGYTALVTLMLIAIIVFYFRWMEQIATKGL